METKICHTIYQWIPEASNFMLENVDTKDQRADNIILRKLAEICRRHLEKDIGDEECEIDRIFKVLNLLYQGGDELTRRMIENEFLAVLSQEKNSNSFKKHLDLFPPELRRGFIKLILDY